MQKIGLTESHFGGFPSQNACHSRENGNPVKKMKLDKNDKTKIKFNDSITISNIPETAWDYKVNGWSAPKWIVERYQYKKDKKTDIINDPNTYSEDPAYILKLLLSVITVSLKTQELVQSLPSIDFDKIISSNSEEAA